ncbi:Clavaminate synthase-like protein [Lophiostoma macrostomum CBS 122681]|uniref:Clavaminate synthase-like protein n=1 Tax=Lophiostoma macrostomum CBS 122681 TaxID=1314788 RepID=A0A6A6TGQ0_9PLEO|nr:Clavaminate synthase-like protein [Lophiostoma macrostomum CBS 122681]
MVAIQIATEVRHGQPDISYAPDYDKYLLRTKQRLATEGLGTTLPPGFPSQLDSNLVWDKDDIALRFDWTYTLDATDLEEVEAALEHFKQIDTTLGFISQSTFPLPTLHSKLRAISKEIHDGFGFKVVRGLPIDKHTREENIIIYAGIASHVAPIRGRQDNEFDGMPADVALNHIKDLRHTAKGSKIGAPAYTTDKQVFHTDAGDIIALLCLETAAKGGESKLSSSWRVYNELASTRPDLVRTLAEDWPAEVFSNPSKRYVNQPLLFHTASTPVTPERLVIQYARRTFTGYLDLPRSSSIPPITEAQAEALDALHFTASKHALTLDFQKGDIQFVNNLSIFHARNGFVDDSESGKVRHLVRLWLRDEEFAWKTPEQLKQRWSGLYDGVTEERQVFPLEGFVRSSARGKG